MILSRHTNRGKRHSYLGMPGHLFGHRRGDIPPSLGDIPETSATEKEPPRIQKDIKIPVASGYGQLPSFVTSSKVRTLQHSGHPSYLTPSHQSEGS